MASVFRRGKSKRKVYQVGWRDADGIRRVRSTYTSDFEAAKRIAAKWEHDAFLMREGIDSGTRRVARNRHQKPPFKRKIVETVAHEDIKDEIDPATLRIERVKANESVKKWLAKFVEELRTGSKRCRKYRRKLKRPTTQEGKQIARDIEIVFERGRIKRLRDIQPEKITEAIQHIRRFGADGRRQGAWLVNFTHYIVSVRNFTRWLSLVGQLPDDPLSPTILPRSIKAELTDFIASVRLRGVSEKECRHLWNRVAAVLKLADIVSLQDIQPGLIAATVKKSIRHRGPLQNHSNANKCVRSIKRFTRWLTRTGRLKSDPMKPPRPRNHIALGISKPPKSIDDLLTDFVAGIQTRIPSSRLLVHSRIKTILALANVKWPLDIQPLPIKTAIDHLRQHGAGKTPRTLLVSRATSRFVLTVPLAGTTLRIYVRDLRRFSSWLRQNGFLPNDPLKTLELPRETQKFRRRMLLPDEFNWLSSTLGKTHPRFLLYATAIQTGYRASELASLKVCDLIDAPDRPFIRCEKTKNGKLAKQFITRELADALRASVKTSRRRASDRLFDMYLHDPSHLRRPAPVLRLDLAAARKQYLAKGGDAESDFLLPTNRADEILDFHSLRHTCGSWLMLKGVNVKVVQSIMRHAKISLTMNTYGHLLPGAEAAAVDAFPATC